MYANSVADLFSAVPTTQPIPFKAVVSKAGVNKEEFQFTMLGQLTNLTQALKDAATHINNSGYCTAPLEHRTITYTISPKICMARIGYNINTIANIETNGNPAATAASNAAWNVYEEVYVYYNPSKAQGAGSGASTSANPNNGDGDVYLDMPPLEYLKIE